MTNSALNLAPNSAISPDGSSGNAGPALIRIQSTASNPKPHFIVADFDAGIDEHLYWVFRMPPDYASGLTAKIQWSTSDITSHNVVWAVKVGATTPADTDTPIEHPLSSDNSVTAANNTTEVHRLIESSITLTNADSVVAGDLVVINLRRDADNASDTVTADARLWMFTIEYVPQ